MAETATFTCEACGETWAKAWSDAETQAEADGLFDTTQPMAVVCDDCWQKMARKYGLRDD